MIKNKGKFREKIAEVLEMPKDIVMDTPLVTLTGNIQMNIENHRGIIEYNEKTIRINTSIGVYKITGNQLIIKSIMAEEIVITGYIENIDISC